MSHLPFALAAYFLNAVAVTIDKFLLVKHIPDPLIYIFYFSLVSVLALLALPFTHIPELPVLAFASLSTILWTAGAYFMFKALQQGHVARVIPIIGTLIPLILLGHAVLDESISLDEIWAVVVLILGLIFLTLPDWKGGIRKKEVLYEVLSATLFAYSYILIRTAFLQDDYFSVLVWSRMILLPLGLFIFLIPSLRNRVLYKPSSRQFMMLSFAGVLFVIAQIAGGLGELLITYSVALANPAVVNSLQGTQYIFLLIFSLVLARWHPQIFKESLGFMNLAGKVLGIFLIGFGLYILSFAGIVREDLKLGVSFSPRYAQSLGLEPKQTFTTMLDELEVSLIRLPVYWDEIEVREGNYDFSKMDFYLTETLKKNTKVILGVGLKQPRWPECHTPPWLSQLPRSDRDQKLLELIKTEVNYFKKYPHIIYWQVENEPFVDFGLCLKPDSQSKAILEKEIEIVKNLDSRPIMITESGELSSWIHSSRRADILGPTLYRTVWNPYFGMIDYPFPPVFYHLKGKLVQLISGKPNQQIIISELQAEPWITGQRGIADVDPDALAKQFTVKKFGKHLNYARETGIKEGILWGVEWWYYMRSNNHPEYVEFAKRLLKTND